MGGGGCVRTEGQWPEVEDDLIGFRKMFSQARMQNILSILVSGFSNEKLVKIYWLRNNF
jgi:hypothetical protein